MRASFRQLFTVTQSHSYADPRVTTVDFVVPAATARLLHRGRLRSRVHEGRLHVLMETNAAGGPLTDLTGTTLRFGVRPRTPSAFTNVTAPLHGGANTPLYRSTAAGVLAAPIDIRVVGPLPRHRLVRPNRPATVSIADAALNVVWSQVVPDATPDVTLDLRRLQPGRYRVHTVDTVGSLEEELLFEPELADCSAVVEVGLDADLYALGRVFTLTFAARNERLRYYIVARNGNAEALSNVTVEDVGHLEDGRPQLMFNRLEAAAFTSAHLPAAAFASNGAAVLLCESTIPVPRVHPGRRHIQLNRSGDVVIPGLPSVGAERTASDLVVHLPQP